MKRPGALAALAILCGAVIAAHGGDAQPAGIPDRWTYPSGQRDPLVPPSALYATQDLPAIAVTLIGVDAHDPGRPLAVVRLDSRPPVRRVVRPGDRIGEYRILRIRRQGVQVAAPSLGGTRVIELAVRDSSSSPTR